MVSRVPTLEVLNIPVVTPSRLSPGLEASGVPEAFRRAVNYQHNNNLIEAERLCRDILAVADHFDTRHLLGVLCFQQGRSAEAADVLAAALKSKPGVATAWCNYGLVLQELGRHEEALASYDKALALKPGNVEAMHNRASSLIELKRFPEALAGYDRVLALNPAYFEALFNRGIALAELGHHHEALKSFDRALAIRPDHIASLNRRGIALDELRRHEEALASYDKALAIAPQDAEVLNNRGIALDALRRHEEAVASYGKALAIKPDYVEALNNRASSLIELGLFDDARAAYEAVFAANPNYAPGHWNRSMLLLRLGSFEAGWREFEWRRKKDSWLQRKLAGPEWAGEEPAGKRIFLYSEAGLGDTIQFARFARCMADAGANVTLEVQPVLAELLQTLRGVTVIPAGEQLPASDFHLPLMSVPSVRGTAATSIPADVPYLAADAARIERWAKRLPRGKFKVGIVWQGNPYPKVDSGRSIPLRSFAPLGAIPGVSLISLQKNDGSEQLTGLPAGLTVETLGADFDTGPDAFLDSAAVMMNLDLIVSSDTAMAHLAGALGRPVWIALKHVPDWRWMRDGDDTPWYPTARLFRQNDRDDWDGVFARIASELSWLARNAKN
jgi:tetratricopeptide (TPR) repeat protein